jgi:hypothetical protein
MRFQDLTFVAALAFVLSLTQGRIMAQTQTANARAKTAGQAWTPPRDTAPTAEGFRRAHVAYGRRSGSVEKQGR